MILKIHGIIDESMKKVFIIQHTWRDLLHVSMMFAVVGIALLWLSSRISFYLYILYFYGFIGFLYFYFPHGKLVFDDDGFKFIKKKKGKEVTIVGFSWNEISGIEYYCCGKQSAIFVRVKNSNVFHAFNIFRFLPFRKAFYFHNRSKWVDENLSEICQMHKTRYKLRTKEIIKEEIKEYK
mgnify:CR=1 FL=1